MYDLTKYTPRLTRLNFALDICYHRPFYRNSALIKFSIFRLTLDLVEDVDSFDVWLRLGTDLSVNINARYLTLIYR